MAPAMPAKPGDTHTMPRMDEPRRLPMFPLGRAVFPGELIPLRVFEDRYLAMITECLAGDGAFGVVLISRGAEVGGGDKRHDVGTLAELLEVKEIEGGHLAVVGAGRGRLRVTEWLPDDPYPAAMVTDAADTASPGSQEHARRAVAALDRLVALSRELGAELGDDRPDLGEEAIEQSYRMAAMAPIGPYDAQRLLEFDDAGDRLDALAKIYIDAEETVRLQLDT
jgi:Lon protease-like protein